MYASFSGTQVLKIYKTIASVALDTEIEKLNYGAYIPLSETPELPAHSVFAIDSNVSVTPLEISDSIAMLPVCRFLEAPVADVPQDIQGRVMPMKILFINETQIIFGSSENQMLLKMGMEYPLSVFVFVNHYDEMNEFSVERMLLMILRQPSAPLLWGTGTNPESLWCM